VCYLIVGASSGVGRALAEEFASAGHALVLVSSDGRDTEALARDLELQYCVPVTSVAVDLAAPEARLADIDAALAGLPQLLGILLPAGANRDDDRPGQSTESFDTITRVNYVSLCHIINRYLAQIIAAGTTGLLVGFGSVAAVRGRSQNAAYAAAKRGLHCYFESLRHALAPAGVIVQFYTLGYLDTNLAFGHATPLPKGAPARLAEAVYRRRNQDFGQGFYPAFWRPVTLLVRAIPWLLFRRMSF